MLKLINLAGEPDRGSSKTRKGECCVEFLYPCLPQNMFFYILFAIRYKTNSNTSVFFYRFDKGYRSFTLKFLKDNINSKIGSKISILIRIKSLDTHDSANNLSHK